MWCHALLLMPVIGLGLFAVLPLPLALPIYLGIVVFSLFIYGKVMQAMRVPVSTGRESMVGEPAWAVTDIAPQGQIRHRGEVWTALSAEPIRIGEKVTIVGFEGMRARVRRV